MWSIDECTQFFVAAIEAEDRRLRDEQAVHGLDALDEVSLHAILAREIESSGLGVLREQPYPTTWKKRPRAKGDEADIPLPRERERCDLVLTPKPGLVIADEVRTRQRVKAVRAEAQETLFQASAERLIASGELRGAEASSPPGSERTISASDAMWIEVKALGQFEHVDGVPVPNRTYASRLMRSVAGDVAKLAGDRMIVHAGVLVTLFAADRATAEHDLLIVAHRCLDRDLPISTPAMAVVPIQERIGNSVCVAAVFPVKRT
ncbi:MAG: hypothetical protein AB7G11_12265 [Phycisphaerales bacterium]